MLLPGANIFVSIFLSIAAVATVIAVGALFGALVHGIVPPMIRKTAAAERYWSGAANADRWYLHSNRWFFIGFWIGAAIVTYCLVGPWWVLLTKLGV